MKYTSEHIYDKINESVKKDYNKKEWVSNIIH